MSDAAPGPLGLFGGTFDPLHVAHLRLALEAREALSLGEVCFIPAGNPALRDAPVCPAADRLAMVERAVAGRAGFSVDAAEVLAARDSAPSYTVDTLERQRLRHGPLRPLVLLIGADAFARFESWHRWRDLFGLAHVAVVSRPAFTLAAEAMNDPLADEFRRRRAMRAVALANDPAGAIFTYTMEAGTVSSTEVRARLSGGGAVEELLPATVLDYIRRHRLYLS